MNISLTLPQLKSSVERRREQMEGREERRSEVEEVSQCGQCFVFRKGNGKGKRASRQTLTAPKKIQDKIITPKWCCYYAFAMKFFVDIMQNQMKQTTTSRDAHKPKHLSSKTKNKKRRRK